jgi:hypothetical protein
MCWSGVSEQALVLFWAFHLQDAPFYSFARYHELNPVKAMGLLGVTWLVLLLSMPSELLLRVLCAVQWTHVELGILPADS